MISAAFADRKLLCKCLNMESGIGDANANGISGNFIAGSGTDSRAPGEYADRLELSVRQDLAATRMSTDSSPAVLAGANPTG